MTTLYAVFREAVYRHACLGIFDDLEEAKRAANAGAAYDTDSHHRYEVVPFELNSAPTFDEKRRHDRQSPSVVEAMRVYEIRQSQIHPMTPLANFKIRRP